MWLSSWRQQATTFFFVICSFLTDHTVLERHDLRLGGLRVVAMSYEKDQRD